MYIRIRVTYSFILYVLTVQKDNVYSFFSFILLLFLYILRCDRPADLWLSCAPCGGDLS